MLRSCLFGLAIMALLTGSKISDPAEARLEAQAALRPFGPLVGPWKGTGQPQRGSTKGAWRETGNWSWKLTPNSAALELTIEQGKYLKSAILKPTGQPGEFQLDAVLNDGSSRVFQGKSGTRDQVVFVAKDIDSKPEQPYRITLSPLHETRFLLLLEAKVPASDRFLRLGEVGYTRQGVNFAVGESYPLCIVTEGRGTIKLEHKGMTYYVCCEGCRDLFKSDPDAVIAEAKAKRDAKRNK
jgi:YHS domain-containing protein